MKQLKKLSLTLALLITAVGGAWAQTQWESGSCTVTLNNGTMTVSGNGAMADYPSLGRPWENNIGDITSVVVESGVTSVGMAAFYYCTAMTSVTLPAGLASIGDYAFFSCSKLTSVTIPSTVTSIGGGAFYGCSAMTSVTLPEGLTAIGGSAFRDCSSLTSITIPSTVTSIGQGAFGSCSAISDVNLYANPDNLTWSVDTHIGSDDFKEGKATQCHVLAEHLSAYQNNFSSVRVTFVGDLQPLPTPIEVTTNAASEQDLFTTASFKMPTFDVDVDYELVRDMSIQMTATMGDGTDGVRYRVKKAQQGQGYEPADMNMMQVLALVAVNDGIEQKDLTLDQDYFCRIYKLDEQTLQPEGDGVKLTDFDFAPGLYALKAFAQDDSDYAGETALSNTFKLFQGYEIVVAANEYATYYKDEALYVEDTDVTLYTITAVSGDKATATEVTTAPAGMPLLVKNNSTETKTILLIPTTDQTPDDVTAADEFLGTLTVKEFTADETSTASYYVCNGKEFVQVRGAGSLGANKAYLKLGGSAAVNAPRLVIGFGGEGTTGISEEVRVKSEEFATAPYYDLNGRKLQGKPTQKGVYIQNGKKVVVK